MSPAERGRELGRAVGMLRRLEQRKRDGALTADDAVKLREVRLALKTLDGQELAVRGTDLTLTQIRDERSALRRRTKELLKQSRAEGLTEDEAAEQKTARERLVVLRQALDRGGHGPRPEPRVGRARPKRISSVVSGGLPGLGHR